jgi:branched-chain amino acid transport system substrate-binding protein
MGQRGTVQRSHRRSGDRANPNFLIWGVAIKDGKPTYIEVGYCDYDRDQIIFTEEGKQYFYE